MKSASIAAYSPRFLSRTVLCVATLALFPFSGVPCAAQEDPTFTIHVYTNLLQIPVLIRSRDLDYVPKVDPARLTVTVDNGPPVHLTHMRPEGDDPLAMAILLDTGDGHNELLPEFTKSLTKISTQSLHPKDMVAIYTLNCDLVPATSFIPADPEQLKIAAASAVDAARHRKTCDHPLHLRDSFALLINDMAQQQGRRVILALTDGKDTGSQISTDQLRQSTVAAGVAIFGLSASLAGDIPTPSNIAGTGRGTSRNLPAQTGGVFHSQDNLDRDFNFNCQNSGGMARSTEPDLLTSSLRNMIQAIRDRFIIEFPWPKSTPGGNHTMDVNLARSDAVVRAAGVGFSIAASDIASDPTEIKSEPAPPTSPLAGPTTAQTPQSPLGSP